MDRIDDTKIRALTAALEECNKSPHFSLGWYESMLKHMDINLKLSKKQVKAFNEMLDDNIRWATKK